MLFGAIVGAVIVKGGFTPSQNMSAQTYIRVCLPASALSGLALWMGNSAFLYLSVSFMQMLKANMPVIIFFMGCLLGTERFRWSVFLSVVIISGGVLVASVGEIDYMWQGVVFLLLGLTAEAARLNLVQKMLQRSDLKLNPLTTLYYIMPASFLFLLPISLVLEGPALAKSTWLSASTVPYLIANAVAACTLNIVIYWVVGQLSALTMKVAAIAKDWLVIASSVVVFGAPVTAISLGGYSIAMVGIAFYNYCKMAPSKPVTTDNAFATPKGSEVDLEARAPLLKPENANKPSAS
jgi:drug/metabolite transporter (DMT)-like permease